MAMAYSLIISGILSQIINSWPSRKLLDYSYFEQLRDIFPSILLALLMGCGVYIINFFQISTIFTLLIQVVIGAIIYIGGSTLLHLEEFEYLFGMVKSFLKR